jgi:hypothetical protein
MYKSETIIEISLKAIRNGTIGIGPWTIEEVDFLIEAYTKASGKNKTGAFRDVYHHIRTDGIDTAALKYINRIIKYNSLDK